MKHISKNIRADLLYFSSPKGVKNENINGGPIGDNKNIIYDYNHSMTSKQREQEHLAYIHIRSIMISIASDSELNKFFNKS